jgi:hypothetical protein
MCRGKDHGDRRCPHDTSEARKRRRRAVQGRELYKQPIFLNPDDNKVIADDMAPRPFKELKKEAQLIGALLHAPVNKDPEIQAEIDAKNELLVTRLGIQLANEAEKRARYNRKSFDRQYEKMSKEFDAVCEEMRPLRTEEQEARWALDKAKGRIWPKNNNFVPDEEEVARLQKIYDEANARYSEVQGRWNEQDQLDEERRKNLRERTMKKLSKAYRSVIADIRPVGGEFKSHELNSDDAVKTFEQTVSKDYPSSWIQASNDADPVIIVAENVRPNYSRGKAFEGEEAKGLTPSVYHTSILGKEDEIKERVRLLSEDGDTVRITGSTFELERNEDGPLLMVRFPGREPFDPAKDSLGTNGKPQGEGWKYGHVLKDDFEIDGTKQWYRTPPNGQGEVAALTIADSSNPAARSHAYHEAIHRFEATLENGAMTRAETAFLNRRTTNNGTKKPLRVIAPAESILSAELASDGGFMTEYIGRVYPDQQAKEIMSVGAEAMFAETHGAFLGLDKRHGQDKDHRGFVLGMFASV